MFFLIGIIAGGSDLGQRRCTTPCCGPVNAYLSYTFQQFTLFFIPLFRFGKQYFLTCPQCGAIYTLTKDEGKRLEKDADAQADPACMHLVRQIHHSHCPRCGAPVEANSRYCPQCGAYLGGQ